MSEEVALEVTSQFPHHPRQFQSMDPGEFLSLLQKHKHPQWSSCGIACNRWGAKQRHNVGLAPHGTIWFATPDMQEHAFSIPCDNIPYTTIKTARWDEDSAQFTDGELVRGWRPAFETLLKKGFLKPSHEMSALIGKNAFDVSPRHLWM